MALDRQQVHPSEARCRQRRFWRSVATPCTAFVVLTLLVGPLLAVLVAAPASVQAATIVVETTSDTNITECTLRDAITAANTDNASGGCTAGSGADTIDLTGLSGTLELQSALPDLASNITLNGPGADQLAIRRADNVETFRIFTTSSVVTVVGLTITNGRAFGGIGGGGILNSGGQLTITASVITGNSTQVGFPNGGGIFNNGGTVTITDSTINGNSAIGNGGGIVNDGMLLITNSTLSGNQAGNEGGGILVRFGGTMSLESSTIALNTAANGGGVALREAAQLLVSASVFADNTSTTGTSNITAFSGGTVDSSGYNLEDGDSDLLRDPTDVTNIDPLLEPLGDYGGPTPTHALSQISPAIDWIPLATCAQIGSTTDQRGVSRPLFDGCDVGAFEYETPVVVERTITNTSIQRRSAAATPAATPDAQPGNMLLIATTLTATLEATSFTLTESLPEGVTFQGFTNNAAGNALYDDDRDEITVSAQAAPGDPVMLAYEVLIDPDIVEGIGLPFPYHVHLDLDNIDVRGSDDVPLPTPIPPDPVTTLVLVYFGAGVDLGADGAATRNSLARSVRGRTDLSVRMLLDGTGENDARIYSSGGGTLEEEPATTAALEYEASADPAQLARFIDTSLRAYPDTDRVILVLAGHGSGISAEPPDARPGMGRAKPDSLLSGLLVDRAPECESLSTAELREALDIGLADSSRTRIDGLYLDACLMGMLEVAYEVRNHVDYVLASPHIKWSYTDYESHMQDTTGDMSVADILDAWIENEADEFGLQGLPYTYALYNVQTIDVLRAAINALVAELDATAPEDRAIIEAALNSTDYYDSDGIEAGRFIIQPNDDVYIDLLSFVRALRAEAARADVLDPALSTAIGDVETAHANVVQTWRFQNGLPLIDGVLLTPAWEWSEFSGGLGLFAPLQADNSRRATYNGGYYRFALDSQWDNLVNAYWGDNLPPQPPPLPTGECGPVVLQQVPDRLFLPVVRR